MLIPPLAARLPLFYTPVVVPPLPPHPRPPPPPSLPVRRRARGRHRMHRGAPLAGGQQQPRHQPQQQRRRAAGGGGCRRPRRVGGQLQRLQRDGRACHGPVGHLGPAGFPVHTAGAGASRGCGSRGVNRGGGSAGGAAACRCPALARGGGSGCGGSDRRAVPGASHQRAAVPSRPAPAAQPRAVRAGTIPAAQHTRGAAAGAVGAAADVAVCGRRRAALPLLCGVRLRGRSRPHCRQTCLRAPLAAPSAAPSTPGPVRFALAAAACMLPLMLLPRTVWPASHPCHRPNPPRHPDPSQQLSEQPATVTCTTACRSAPASQHGLSTLPAFFPAAARHQGPHHHPTTPNPATRSASFPARQSPPATAHVVFHAFSRQGLPRPPPPHRKRSRSVSRDGSGQGCAERPTAEKVICQEVCGPTSSQECSSSTGAAAAEVQPHAPGAVSVALLAAAC